VSASNVLFCPLSPDIIPCPASDNLQQYPRRDIQPRDDDILAAPVCPSIQLSVNPTQRSLEDTQPHGFASSDTAITGLDVTSNETRIKVPLWG
jgi:hypothetical protein